MALMETIDHPELKKLAESELSELANLEAQKI